MDDTDNTYSPYHDTRQPRASDGVIRDMEFTEF
ncbi:hypothetical protein LILAB_03970 [Corallococcus macrosporus]|uniref:Uncharacterized protein n=1 Tax=Myxococcus fulvus (strain ATCC BAA-855 / HW-1) TaxID=483219 RepID=F8CKQ4_MYXFH|nr:hypothetical protein LILAB_03970 [Corallococcus macrosporus]